MSCTSHHEVHLEMAANDKRMKPSQVPHAYELARARAAKTRTCKILEFFSANDNVTGLTSVPIDKALFEATPSEVWIDEYTPYHLHTTRLVFRNRDSVPRRLRIEMPDSCHFRIVPLKAKSSDGASSTGQFMRIDGKVAAGMEIVFQLEFHPHEVNEYAIDIVCCTEREKFVIPVHVRGTFGALDLADEFAFGVCPVRLMTTKVVTARNIGSRRTKFSFECTSSAFRVTPQYAVLEPKARAYRDVQNGVQLQLEFLPMRCGVMHSLLLIHDDTGHTTEVQLTGDAHNIDVYLSAPMVEPKSAYITLSSRKSIKICNQSDFPLDFAWKAFADEASEQQERRRLLDDLGRMEDTEKELQGQSAASEEELARINQALSNKYNQLRKAVHDDLMLFVDECFSLQPLKGRVWAHSETDVVVAFAPLIATLYSCNAHLEVSGQESRLPLQIRGQGIGPKARVMYNDLLNLGDVFIGEERQRNFTIQNRGEIPVDFKLVPIKSPDRVHFDISPSSGTLAVNETCTVELKFSSQLLGEFAQVIAFELAGAEEKLTVRFKANVIPPVVLLDTDTIDYGQVSLSFPQRKLFKLINSSKISINYSLHIPEEANLKRKEFDLMPSRGKLDAYSERDIRMDLLPFNLRKYEYHLVVSVVGVESNLLTLPIRAESLVPEVLIEHTELDYGQCFLRYPHKQTLHLHNKSSHLSARFEIVEQNEQSRAIANYNTSEFSGIIRPEERVAVDVYLSCEKLGSIRMPMTVCIVGSTELPLPITLIATGIGPRVELDQQEINFGNCTCLVDHYRSLTMKNVSLIPAVFKTFIRNARSKFLVDRREGTLLPGESVEFTLTANLDDTVVFKDQLHIMVMEADILVVPLTIKGTGTTMWSPSDLRVIDFNCQMTCRECEWSCTIENKGKRPQQINWINRTTLKAKETVPKEDRYAATSKAKAKAKPTTVAKAKPQLPAKEGSDDILPFVPVFSVFPNSIELKPRTACMFVFKGLSTNAGVIVEEMVCETRVGKEKNPKVAFVTQVKGDFINPALQPSASSLFFSYVYEPGVEILHQSQPLRLTNVCALPLTFTLKTSAPFSLDCWEATLAPQEFVDLHVEFYPGFKDDHLTRVINGKVMIVYANHPQKDAVEVIGDINFPNLQFETMRIDFGCALNDTQKSLCVKVTNISKVDSVFRWVFIEDDKESSSQFGGGAGGANIISKRPPPIAINQVFDILPNRGRLKPGETETVEFLYYGHANRRFKAQVACEVEGGPEYELLLLGEASSLSYKLDKSFLDFGPIVFDRMEDRDFSILNLGKVPFSFNISVEPLANNGRSVDVTPLIGRIVPNDKQRILVRLKPGIPERIEETITIEVAHFQPVAFKLFATGIFASLSMNLPREPHPNCVVQGKPPKWKELLKKARRQLQELAANPPAVPALLLDNNSNNNNNQLDAKLHAKLVAEALNGSGTSSPQGRSPSRGHSSSSPSRPPALFDDLDVEVEACRLFFADYLLVQEAKAKPVKLPIDADAGDHHHHQNNNNNNNKQDADDDSPTIQQHKQQQQTRKQPRKSSSTKPQPSSSTEAASNNNTNEPGADSSIGSFVLCNFALDFGNVVLGTHKIKKFVVTNIGPVPTSFVLDKNLAKSRGFQIEPERVARLPEKQSVEFTVTFQARRNIALGLHEVQLSVTVKNGPPCVFTLRANVTVPDIAISHDSLDFGRIAVGTSHTIFTQLHNPTSVPAEWAIKKPMGATRDLKNFRIAPNLGTLPPSAKVNVKVEFVPDEGRLFAIKLPIKITSNAKPRMLSLKGEASDLRVSFKPSLLELGPILPCSCSAEKQVEIVNDSDYPVEVVSLDFDQKYLKDEELLRSVEGFGSEEFLRLSLRSPGQSWREYLASNNFVLPPEMAPEVAPISVGQEASEDTKFSTARSETAHTARSEGGTKEADQADPPANEAAVTAVLAEEKEPRQAFDYVLVGPRQCGKTTQAKLLAERENLRVWNVQSALEKAALLLTPLGDRVRKLFGIEEDDAQMAPAQGQETEATPVGEEQEQPEQDNPGADLSLESTQSSVSAPESPTDFAKMVLGDVIEWQLNQAELTTGSVLDGFENFFLSVEDTVRVCAKVMTKARVVLLDFDEETYDSLRNQIAQSIPEITPEISEREPTPRPSDPAEAVAVAVPAVSPPVTTHAPPPVVNSKDPAVIAAAAAQAEAEAAAAAAAAQAAAEAAARAARLERIQVAMKDKLQELQRSKPVGVQSFTEYSEHLSAFKQLFKGFVVGSIAWVAPERAAAAVDAPKTLPAATATATTIPSLGSPGTEPSGAVDPREVAWMPKKEPVLVVPRRLTSQNFFVEVHINDVGPSLLMHNTIVAAIDKCVRELDMANLPIPVAVKNQLVRKPLPRFARKPIQRFSLVPEKPVAGAAALDPAVDAKTDTARSAVSAVSVGSAREREDKGGEVAPDAAAPPAPPAKTRWCIEPRSSVVMSLEFASDHVGVFDSSLGFEIIGTRREFNLFCRGTCGVPTINSDPRNVFMNRIKAASETAIVQKKFVLNKSVFEFGPLVIDGSFKSPSTLEELKKLLPARKSCIEVFRISNSSKLPIHLDCCLEKTTSNCFFALPASLDLPEGETGEIFVGANPTETGIHTNSLVCCITDNPEPVCFALSCLGCLPQLALRGPWDQATGEGPIQVDNSMRSSTPPGSSRTPVLVFDRLLLHRHDEKTVVLENRSLIPVAWRLAAAASSSSSSLPPDFRISPSEGVIRPLQKCSLLVVFTANVEAKYDHEVQIEFADVDAMAKDDKEKPKRHVAFRVHAEAYFIDVCSFEKDSSGKAADGTLDFGVVRVGESHTKSFTIKNRGKYNVKYIMSIRSASSRALFSIDPMELVLEPDKVAEVKVSIEAKSEVTLRDCRDIKCSIIELMTGETYSEFLVLMTVRSVFSVFRLQPTKSINFGPVKFNDAVKTKRLEIRNDGEFAFKFRIRSASLPVKDKLTMAAALTPAALVLGQFTVNPDSGTIDPGTTASLEVVFQPKDAGVYRELLHVDISGRRVASDEPPDLDYELVGESCYPGINSSDYDDIFEEQAVVRSVGPEWTNNDPNGGMQPPQQRIQSVVFAEKEKVFSFAPMIASTTSKGVVERFKISNPTKVTTVVRFSVSSMGLKDAKDTKDDPIANGVFTVQPTVWEIPPLEHRFVNVHFKPVAITTYHAVFAAKAEDSPLPAMNLLQFELRGEGTMPCVSVVSPTQRDASGMLLMNFGRVRLSRAKDLSFSLRNDGILPCTVLFSFQSNPNFAFSFGNGSLVLVPGTSETLAIQFKPLKAQEEPFSTLLKTTVQGNPFDETSFRVTGVGYRDDVTFEDLPEGHDDELHFDDISLPPPDVPAATNGPSGTSSEVYQQVRVFSLCNQTNEPMKFTWPKDLMFSFSPSVGHLKPKSHKAITAKFTPPVEPKAFTCSGQKIALALQRINYKDAAQSDVDWDENARVVAFGDHGDSPTNQPVVEPAFDAMGAASTLNLNCFAAADVISYESSTRGFAFKETFMLQVCTHKLTVKNKSKIKLEYAWTWKRSTTSSGGVGEDPTAFTSSLEQDQDPREDDEADEDCPFSVSPHQGSIAADATESFVVKFAPMEVETFHYKLVFHAKNAVQNAKDKSSEIDVRGASLRPACHFDVERSDYAQRRAPHLPGPNGELGPLDPSIKIIEMESLGVRVRNTRRFYVVNPTNISYEFVWVPESELNNSFRCATPKGLMLAGKRCEMTFEFTPQHVDLQEMFWRFKVPTFQVDQLFLLVGTTTEPRVSFDRGSLNFNTLMIGTRASQSIALVNQEHIPFNFVLDKTSMEFPGEPPALLAHPLSGVVPPNGRTSIEIEFVPSEEKTYSFNVNCIVKRKPSRLNLNIKGEGYSIHDALMMLQPGKENEAQVVLFGQPNVLDFGIVHVNEQVERAVVVQNTGKFNFEFSWGTAAKHPALAIEPMSGTVKKNDKQLCRLLFFPTKQTSLDGVQLSCTVASSRTYSFNVQGSALPPSLQMSFTSYDFGPCFVAEADPLQVCETTSLSVFNQEPECSIDLDCAFERKPHLRVDFAPAVLGPRESVTIPIVFTARQEGPYLEVIPFVINGTTTVNVSVRGEGVLPRVELVNSAAQVVGFGALVVGQSATRTVRLINKCKKKTPLRVFAAPATALDNETFPSLESLGVLMFPQEEILVRPKETVEIEFRFAPTQRVQSFEREIMMCIAGSNRKLLTLSGSCHGMEVQLDTDTLSFGTVCLGSQLTKRISLRNRGDLLARFSWQTKLISSDFIVTPVDGILPPNQHKSFEITYKPSQLYADLRYEKLICSIENGEPLHVTLSGCCVKQAASSIQDLHFESKVREETSKQVVIENKTKSPWNLTIVVKGDHWHCPENLAVPADGKATLTVLYCPLTMTRQEIQSTGENGEQALASATPTSTAVAPSPAAGTAASASDSTSALQTRPATAKYNRPDEHNGSIFMAIPDGTALLFNLFGKAFPPTAAGTLSFTTNAKKTLAISIPIKNWLKEAQLLSVEMHQQPSRNNEAVVLQGANSLALAAGVTKTYKLKFMCYVEGPVAFSVQFTNTENGEFLFFDVNVLVTASEEAEVLHFDVPVRQSLKRVVRIENPFPTRAVHFVDKTNWWKCTSANVRVKQLSEISERAEGVYEVEYRPTIHSAKPVEATLSMHFVELGEYRFKLMLATQAPGIERILHFKTPLGTSQSQSFSFVSYTDRMVDYACLVHEPTAFAVAAVCKVEPSTAWEGRNCSVQVKFEPEALGEFRDTLEVSSDVAGHYKCALQGIATPPLPQGPFVFATSRDIEFKNVFSAPRDFELSVDNPRFVVAAKVLSIPAKGSKMITIKIDPNGGVPGVPSAGAGKAGGAHANAAAAAATTVPGSAVVHGSTGKLFVTCPSLPNLPPWVYYLEVTPPPS